MKVIQALIEKRMQIRKVYKSGIGESFLFLRYILPSIFLMIFLLLINGLNKPTQLIDVIKQLNSLVGIVLGFSIASFAIFISISNEKLEEKSQSSKYTYREIGSSLFFYNVEVSLFTSIIGILLLFIDIPLINFEYIMSMTYEFSFLNLKVMLFVIYIVIFFQLIFNLFYSSIFLNSSIKK